MTEVATNAAVSSLLQTAVSYDGGQSLQSDSERTITGDKKRLTCICHVGDACQIMTTAFHSMKDPRGCFVVVPSYEVQLREAYCRYLLPGASGEEIDQIDDFVVAVHHFHPTIIDRCFNTNHEERPEDNVLPMPERTTPSTTALQYLLDDEDRVVNHQTGAPTGEYWVVPSYSFDAAHGDLKQSMGDMPQMDLERCVRRMKREARRQKWEAIVDKWDAVSKRSSFYSVPPSPSPSTGSNINIVPPSSNTLLQGAPSLPDVREVHNTPPSVIFHRPHLAHAQATTQRIVNDIQVSNTPDMFTPPVSHQLEDDELDVVRRGSLMTAQEVLESELGDDESIPDLNAVEDPESSDSEAHASNPPVTEEDNACAPLKTTSIATPAAREQDDGSLSSLSNEGCSHSETQGSKATEAAACLETKAQENKTRIKETQAEQEVTPEVPKTEELQLQDKPSATSPKPQTLPSPQSFLKSRAGTAVAVGAFCVYTVSTIMSVSNCRAILQSREEAFV